MVRVTNVVCTGHLKCEIDLKHLVSVSRDVYFNLRKKDNSLVCKHLNRLVIVVLYCPSYAK